MNLSLIFLIYFSDKAQQDVQNDQDPEHHRDTGFRLVLELRQGKNHRKSKLEEHRRNNESVQEVQNIGEVSVRLAEECVHHHRCREEAREDVNLVRQETDADYLLITATNIARFPHLSTKPIRRMATEWIKFGLIRPSVIPNLRDSSSNLCKKNSTCQSGTTRSLRRRQSGRISTTEFIECSRIHRRAKRPTNTHPMPIPIHTMTIVTACSIRTCTHLETIKCCRRTTTTTIILTSFRRQETLSIIQISLT